MSCFIFVKPAPGTFPVLPVGIHNTPVVFVKFVWDLKHREHDAAFRRDRGVGRLRGRAATLPPFFLDD
jgi:hypothetical protein